MKLKRLLLLSCITVFLLSGCGEEKESTESKTWAEMVAASKATSTTNQYYSPTTEPELVNAAEAKKTAEDNMTFELGAKINFGDKKSIIISNPRVKYSKLESDDWAILGPIGVYLEVDVRVEYRGNDIGRTPHIEIYCDGEIGDWSQAPRGKLEEDFFGTMMEVEPFQYWYGEDDGEMPPNTFIEGTPRLITDTKYDKSGFQKTEVYLLPNEIYNWSRECRKPLKIQVTDRCGKYGIGNCEKFYYEVPDKYRQNMLDLQKKHCPKPCGLPSASLGSP